ncbi:MAG: hypothetical protein KME46_09270 [Brasilonema angustatum HA4187-MV1]|jgi:predicted Rossmann-fold nucleotide-binding protein|nr:hypothetical protein [Brasilonema angustatum HA4187-MV1]
MSARNVSETTVELKELSDADLMVINGGSVGTAVDDLLVTLGAGVTPIIPPVGALLTTLGTFGK